MRGYTRAATAIVSLGLAVSMAACSSSGSGSGSSSTPTTSGSSSDSASASTGSGSAGGTAGTNPSAAPVGAFSTLTGQSTTVALDSGFLAALKSLKVTPATVGTAKLSGADISFPITGGNAKIYKKGEVTPYVQGTIDHNGSGLSLTAGGTTVTLENFVVNPGANSELTGKVLVNGKVFAASVKLFDLDGSTLQTPSISSAGVATLTGTTVYVSQAAAGALNTAFKLTGTSNALPTTKDAIKVGIATIKATGK